ncbi:hypothetical protein [Ferrovum myxofaciens]|uniref:Polymer-forming cytoskeletal protein n=1 Tax=Ferrovum myxofaciens TaxID=416213 RepID=A0A9E6SXX3_9PROT|nr:hypothetical protein [Ferrovum myxofaciens]QKE37461.2 MAG: hypothetical protein HO273_00855 [Ferrovum myxofaciens]QWY75109.1 MAG: hypothetical protein JVY19_01275 [Ferrovum myxofaciens]QWY77844.1 MAG: hypothetical protein JZL65_01780 [Ferrovum myxofaciens]
MGLILETFDFEDGNGPVPAHRHKNPDGSAGGWVAETARVSILATVGPNAQVFGNAQVLDRAQVYGEAFVHGQACVFGNAQVYGDAHVFGNAQVYGKARVSGQTRVYGEAVVSGPNLRDELEKVQARRVQVQGKRVFGW